MNTNRLRLACATVVLTLSVVLTSTASAATLLSTLISTNGSLVVGNLMFSNFNYLNTGDMPSDSGVNVVPYTDGLGNNGLLFQGAFTDLIGGAGSDALIGFTVTELSETSLITGATLTGNPVVLGGSGVASVTETFQPTDTNLTLSIFAISPGPTKSTDSGSFIIPHQQVVVQKDVLTFSATVGGGSPSLSFITQTFHETNTPIPEPASIVLAGSGTLLLGLFACKLRRRRS